MLNKRIGLYFLSFSLVSSFFYFSNVRVFLRGLLAQEQRQVLRSIAVSNSTDSTTFEIIKVQDGQNLIVEFYLRDLKNNTLALKQTHILKNSQDGRVNLSGKIVSIAAEDFDNDGIIEILIPYFDANLIARLAAYKYNRLSGYYDFVNPPTISVD